MTPGGELEAWEVFRQEKDGDPMRHGGSVMAPDAELATHYARELFGRRQESVRLWVVRRADIVDLADPDLLQPPLDRSFKKPGGYVMRDKLAAARELSGAGQAEGRSSREARSAVTVAALPAVALGELLRSMADDEFVIGFSDSEWTGIAPLLEEDVAMSSLAQDELGHAAALYGLLGELTRRGPRRARLRPRARRLPPLPPARPRPRRLGDDDRPPLPVRHAPTPSGSRRWPAAPGRRWPTSSAS